MENKLKNRTIETMDNIINQYNVNYSDETVAKTKEFISAINPEDEFSGFMMLALFEVAFDESKFNDGIWNLCRERQRYIFSEHGKVFINDVADRLQGAFLRNDPDDVFRCLVANEDLSLICFEECGGEHDPGHVWNFVGLAGVLYLKSKGLTSNREIEEDIQARRDFL